MQQTPNAAEQSTEPVGGLSNGRLPMFPDLVANIPTYPTGILPSQRIRELIDGKLITAEIKIDESQIQPASLDLRLGRSAFRVLASFLPSPTMSVTKRLRDLAMHEIDLSQGAVMEKSCVYIVPLMEQLELPSRYYGKANPKSTTGRLDIFTRLITEYGEEFERIPQGYHGGLYLEVVPRTFPIKITEGSRLTQVRFARAGLSPQVGDTGMEKLHEIEALLYGDDETPVQPRISRGLRISVDLRQHTANRIIGFRARPHTPAVDFEKVSQHDPAEFWEPVYASKTARVILNPGDFYILSSQERVSVPPTVAAELVGYDPSVGEFRVHYAGFFDPGFGYSGADAHGTRAVLEVRSHEVPFLLEDGQHVGRLNFERLMDVPDKLYGTSIGSSYSRQGLKLSKQFRAVSE